MSKVYQAYATGAKSVYHPNPRGAAETFFQTNPNKRKCNLTQGVHADGFFTVTYGRASKGQWPTMYKDVTRASVSQLPA